MIGALILAGVVDDYGNHIRALDLSQQAYMARHWFYRGYDAIKPIVSMFAGAKIEVLMWPKL